MSLRSGIAGLLMSASLTGCATLFPEDKPEYLRSEVYANGNHEVQLIAEWYTDGCIKPCEIIAIDRQFINNDGKRYIGVTIWDLDHSINNHEGYIVTKQHDVSPNRISMDLEGISIEQSKKVSRYVPDDTLQERDFYKHVIPLEELRTILKF